MATRDPIEPSRLVACVVFVALFATARAVQAADAPAPRAALVVTRGPGADDCPDAEGLAARMRGITPADIVASGGGSPRDTWVEVELSSVLSGYRAVISARGRRHGTRTIDDVGPGCASLADAVAITLVMLLDPEALPSPPAPVRSAPIPTPAAPPSDSERPPVTLGVEIAGGAKLAALEHPAFALELGARLGIGPRAGVAFGGGYVFPDSVDVAGGTVTLALAYGYLRGFLSVFERGGTRLALTAGPELGSLSGEGRNYDIHQPKRRVFWLAADGGPELEARLLRWLVWSARVLAVVPLIRQGFDVDDGGKPTPAFRTKPIGVMLALGLAADL